MLLNFKSIQSCLRTLMCLAVHGSTKMLNKLVVSGRRNEQQCVRKPTIRVPTRSDTNRAVQEQKLVRGWKFWI